MIWTPVWVLGQRVSVVNQDSWEYCILTLGIYLAHINPFTHVFSCNIGTTSKLNMEFVLLDK